MLPLLVRGFTNCGCWLKCAAKYYYDKDGVVDDKRITYSDDDKKDNAYQHIMSFVGGSLNCYNAKKLIVIG
jgi:hypothetical protein